MLSGIATPRPGDTCDFHRGMRLHDPDPTVQHACTNSTLTGTIVPIPLPAEVLSNYTFVSVVPIDGCETNHFVSYLKNGDAMDLYFTYHQFTSWPRLIRINETAKKSTTEYDFTAFDEALPTYSYDFCQSGIKNCFNYDTYICHANPYGNQTEMGLSITWICANDWIKVDCSPINPGGSEYFPNTLIDHCNWAYAKYYEKWKDPHACDFASTGLLTPPKIQPVRTAVPKHVVRGGPRHPAAFGDQPRSLASPPSNPYFPDYLTCPA